MSTDSPINHPWPDGEPLDHSKNYALSGRIMLASIIILFVVVVFLVILHLYARWYLLRPHFRNVARRRRNTRNRSTRIVFYVDNNRALASSSGGLDASVLKSLPVFVYSSETDDDMPECAVCLSEFEEGETGRVLPKCKHNFHTGCIDMWFHSNSTCPLCRSRVEAVETELTILVEQQETTSFVDGMKGNDVGSGSSASLSSPVVQPVGAGVCIQTTSFADRTKRIDVRIDIPNRNELAAETESPSHGFRSPGGRLLSRIINMSRKSPAMSPASGVGPSCVRVATELDLESAHESSRPEAFR